VVSQWPVGRRTEAAIFRRTPLSDTSADPFRVRVRSSRATSAVIALVAAAVLLDAWCRPLPVIAPAIHWLDFAALACVAWGMRWSTLFAGEDEATPLDGLLLGTLAIGAVQVIGTGGRGGTLEWLSHAVAGAGVYFGLVRALRREPAAVETLWRALAGIAIALGVHAIWAATAGLAGVAAAGALADGLWAGKHVLAKLACFLTVVVAGRAFERGAAPLWRIAAGAGAAGAVLHVAAGGFGMGSSELARIDDPNFFSTLSVTLMLIVAVAREAWDLARARPYEAWRWRALACAVGALGVGGTLGGASGGEGVRVLTGLVAAAVMTVRTLPAGAVEALPATPEAEAEDVPVSRAA
jgi:hypothetical protein